MGSTERANQTHKFQLLFSNGGELLPNHRQRQSRILARLLLAAFPLDKRRRSRLCVSLVDLPMLRGTVESSGVYAVPKPKLTAVHGILRLLCREALPIPLRRR